MRLDYLIRRVLLFFIIVWLAATVNFFIPRLSGQDPVREKLLQQAVSGGYVHTGMEAMVKEYEKKFGLDRPLWVQYLTYLGDMAQFNLGYSLSNYPKTVAQIMGESLPWTMALLSVATIFAFAIGSILGALLAWPRAPRFLQFLLPPLLTLSAVPYFLLGLGLLYLFAFQNKWFPLSGGYTPGTFPDWSSLNFWLDVLWHSVLPALSILLVSIGFWALGMRGMMVTVQGEDFMTFAEAKGLKGSTLFLRYAMRNAILPQVTSLALALGHITSGSVLVEVIFGYPGIGTVLYHAIREVDYFLIQGIIFTVIVGIGLATLILDLAYPLIDPRISYRRA